MSDPCPICRVNLVKRHVQGDRFFFECPKCGPYSLSGSAHGALAWQLSQRPNAALKLSYALRRITKRQAWAMLDSDMLGDIILNTELPRPQEQFENLILWLGDSLPAVGAIAELTDDAESWTGVPDKSSLKFLIDHGTQTGYLSAITSDFHGGVTHLRLTMQGWVLYEQLKRGRSTSNRAFIAMQFGNDDLDSVVKDYFKPAVASTGFELKRLDDSQPAGLIDDRLRVEIRQSRFLLADLTHHNKGAYWEAGYAEGLGKPVIYLCRKDVFDNRQEGTHFDTNHHLTVVWDPEHLSDAAAKLKATIRATLPDESKFTD